METKKRDRRGWEYGKRRKKVMAIFSRRLVGKTVTRLTPTLPCPVIGSSRKNSDKFTLLHDDSGGCFYFYFIFVFHFSPDPIYCHGTPAATTAAAVLVVWFTSLPTRRHFNAVQSPFNKPINELLCWHAEMTRSMGYVKVLPKGTCLYEKNVARARRRTGWVPRRGSRSVVVSGWRANWWEIYVFGIPWGDFDSMTRETPNYISSRWRGRIAPRERIRKEYYTTRDPLPLLPPPFFVRGSCTNESRTSPPSLWHFLAWCSGRFFPGRERFLYVSKIMK